MVAEFFNLEWNFLEVSQNYILGDCKALHQIMVKFCDTLVVQFPVDPLSVLSAPSAAFKIWRTVQLPRLHEEGHRVYDLSKTLDNLFRKAYHGGIVDVYRPHLIGEGWYYDVNSLYPTAMSMPMPVGMPQNQLISIGEFQENLFFGYIEATVKAPDPSTHAGYIGLLPIKHQGRFICPTGQFRGYFFSEELRFALQNGYSIIQIHNAIGFKRGFNCLKSLINTLNDMKVQAQLNGKPTIRNIAQLLMNSMYGRFGMNVDDIIHDIMNKNEISRVALNYVIKEEIDFGILSLVSYTQNSTPPSYSLGTKGQDGLAHLLFTWDISIPLIISPLIVFIFFLIPSTGG
jgi:hypothetical protein